MQRSTDRILATHTGKLFLPSAGYLGMGPPATAPERVREEVTELVRAQVEIGMDVVSNGEPAGIGPSAIFSLIEGFESVPANVAEDEPVVSPERIRFLSRDMLRFSDFYSYMYGPMRARSAAAATAANRTVVSGPLKLRTLEPFQRDLDLFKEVLAQHAPGREAFYCVVAPAWLEEFIWNQYYETDDDFVVALSEVMAPIFKTVTDAGLILQLDDPAISHDFEEVKRPEMNLEDYERFIMVRVEALNAALEAVPEEMIRYHTCWGSWPGMHTGELPLRDIVRPMLKVKAQALSLESAKSTHRADWKVWRDDVKLPEGKVLIPGVVDHTTNVVEPPEVIADQLVQLAGVVGRENVIAGTDCGMRGHAQANWEKYKNIVKGAELASAQLWR